MDSESTIDADIQFCIDALQCADKKRWDVGERALPYLGQYQNGVIQAIADGARVDRSQIENYCHAYDLYQRLGCASELRDQLTITHYATMWGRQRKYSLTDGKCLMYLTDADRYGYSSRQLEAEVEAHENATGNVPTFEYYLPRVKSLLVGMAAIWDSLSDEWKAWIKSAPKMDE